MSLAAEYSIAQGAPATMNHAAWRKFVPPAVREAYWREIGDKEVGGGIGVLQRQIEQNFTGTVRLADVLRALPQAAPVQAPAPDNPVIRTWGDLFRLCSDEQVSAYFALLARAKGVGARTAAEAALTAGSHAETRADILRFIAFRLAYVDRGFRVNGVRVRASVLTPLAQPRELGSLNTALASRWASGMVEPGEGFEQRRASLRAFALANEGHPNASDQQLAAVAAARISQLFTAQGLAFDEAVERQQALPLALDNTSGRVASINAMVGSAVDIGPQVAGSGGIGDSFKRLVRHPLKWFRNVLEEVGKGVQHAAQAILDTEENVPWLSTFLLKPLGFHAQAQLLNQLGAVLVDGSVSAFDEKAVAKAGADTFTAAGQALLIAAPFLPVPYNIAAAAIGAVSIAAGTAINRAIAEKEASRKVEAAKEAAEAAAREAATQADKARAELAALETETPREAVLGPAPITTKRATGPPRWFLPAAAGIAALALVLATGGKT